ncbi:hypothetical protein C4J94_5120 [Pseudomonas sp. R5-89-07]|nr:hypothetical protein C4J94_5120 [Pseudomonas sp. R5-89-07]
MGLTLGVNLEAINQAGKQTVTPGVTKTKMWEGLAPRLRWVS